MQYYAINHWFYVFAQTTGTYTFSFSNVDDILFLWTGSVAKTSPQGTTRANANLVLAYPSPRQGSYTVSLTAGQYLPVMIQMGQGDGPSAFSLSITDPTGRPIQDGTASTSSTPSGDIVAFSCDGTAPRFGAVSFTG